MSPAAFSLNYVGIFSSLIVTVLLVTGLTVGLRLMKISYAPAWAMTMTAVLGAFLFGFSGRATVSVLFLLAVPLLAAAIYQVPRMTSAKQVSIVAAGGAVVVAGFVLLNTQYEETILSELRDRESAQMQRVLMTEQAAVVRHRREQYEQQRRELFEAKVQQPESSGEIGIAPAAIDPETLRSSSGVAWYPEVDERFDADIHSSMSAAGRELGRKLAGLINHSSKAETEPPIIQIHASRTRMHDDFDQALNGLATVMRTQYPQAQVLVDYLTPSNSITRLDPEAISIRLNMSVVESRTPAPWDSSRTETVADILAELDTGPNKVSTSVRMIDKPWVHDFDQFVNSNRGNGILITGRSGRLASRRTEAWNAAIEDAVSALTPLATEVLKAQKRVLVRNPKEDEVANRLRKELLAGQLIEDSFLQQLSHPMGNLWREAVLVRVDYPWLERVFSDYLQRRQQEQLDRLSLGAALTVLLIGILVLHAFLNWATRGYHRTTIGMLSALIAIAGGTAIVIVAIKLRGGWYV